MQFLFQEVISNSRICWYLYLRIIHIDWSNLMQTFSNILVHLWKKARIIFSLFIPFEYPKKLSAGLLAKLNDKLSQKKATDH